MNPSQYTNKHKINSHFSRYESSTINTEVYFQKKPKATKLRDQHSIILTAWAAKTVARTLTRRFGNKIKHVGFNRGRGTRNQIWMLTMSEWTLDTDEEVSACFVHWQKAFEHAKLGQISPDPKEHWYPMVYGRRLISKLYIYQC